MELRKKLIGIFSIFRQKKFHLQLFKDKATSIMSFNIKTEGLSNT